MLVGYSSSSEEDGEPGSDAPNRSSRRPAEDDEGNRHLPEKKKARTEELDPKTRLPLPGCLLSMFPDDDHDAQTEDSSLHGGRVRTFKHERGNWATYVYLPYSPEEEFEELLEEVLSVLEAHGLIWTRQEEFHLSVSQTVVLRHHWIQPFIQSLKAGLSPCRRFVCTAATLKVYCNAERTRISKSSPIGAKPKLSIVQGIINSLTGHSLNLSSLILTLCGDPADNFLTFLGMEVSTGHPQLMDLVRVVDKTMTDFGLDTFYKEPSFHVSLAWCVGDLTEKTKEILEELQSLVDNREEGPFLLTLPCAEVRCSTGNKTFRFPLKP